MLIIIEYILQVTLSLNVKKYKQMYENLKKQTIPLKGEY